MHLGHPVVDDLVAILGGQADEVGILGTIVLMDAVVAADHVDHFADAGLFGSVEHHLVLTHIYLELDVIICFHSTAVHQL
jgi:hypothetical protein